MKDARKAILENRFSEYKDNFTKDYLSDRDHEWIKAVEL